jgi:hypothetical protein
VSVTIKALSLHPFYYPVDANNVTSKLIPYFSFFISSFKNSKVQYQQAADNGRQN